MKKKLFLPLLAVILLVCALEAIKPKHEQAGHSSEGSITIKRPIHAVIQRCSKPSGA